MTTAVPATGTSADLIATAVLATPVVAGLHGGRFGEVATYLPGRRVAGVRVDPDAVEIHLTAYYPASVTEIDAAVRASLTTVLPARTVLTIVIEDMEKEMSSS